MISVNIFLNDKGNSYFYLPIFLLKYIYGTSHESAHVVTNGSFYKKTFVLQCFPCCQNSTPDMKICNR